MDEYFWIAMIGLVAILGMCGMGIYMLKTMDK